MDKWDGQKFIDGMNSCFRAADDNDDNSSIVYFDHQSNNKKDQGNDDKQNSKDNQTLGTKKGEAIDYEQLLNITCSGMNSSGIASFVKTNTFQWEKEEMTEDILHQLTAICDARIDGFTKVCEMYYAIETSDTSTSDVPLTVAFVVETTHKTFGTEYQYVYINGIILDKNNTIKNYNLRQQYKTRDISTVEQYRFDTYTYEKIA